MRRFLWTAPWTWLMFDFRPFIYDQQKGRISIDRRSAGNWAYWIEYNGVERHGNTGMGTGSKANARRIVTMRLHEFLDLELWKEEQ